MVEDWVLPIIFEAVGALVAAVAAWRIWRLNRVVEESRLRHLDRFFIFFALAALVNIASFARLQTLEVVSRDTVDALDVLFWLHHGLVLAAALSAGLAMGIPRRSVAALAPTLLAAEPALRIMEAVAFAFLVTRASFNHVRQTNFGSLRVAAGFFLLFAAHVLLAFVGTPLGARDPWAEALNLGGLVVLASALPWRRAPPG